MMHLLTAAHAYLTVQTYPVLPTRAHPLLISSPTLSAYISTYAFDILQLAKPQVHLANVELYVKVQKNSDTVVSRGDFPK